MHPVGFRFGAILRRMLLMDETPQQCAEDADHALGARLGVDRLVRVEVDDRFGVVPDSDWKGAVGERRLRWGAVDGRTLKAYRIADHLRRAILARTKIGDARVAADPFWAAAQPAQDQLNGLLQRAGSFDGIGKFADQAQVRIERPAPLAAPVSPMLSL